MNRIKIHFVEENHLNLILNDEEFQLQSSYLNPVKFENNFINITDNNEFHDILATEVLILTICARAIKRIIYPDTTTHMEFLEKYPNHPKNGLRHGNSIIIDQCRFE